MFEPVSYTDHHPALPVGTPLAALNPAPAKPQKQTDDVEVIEEGTEDLPIKAWKVAILRTNDTGSGVVLTAAAHTTQEHIGTQKATCVHREHEAPKRGCTCGFYAYRTVAELHRHGIISGYSHKSAGQVLLQCDLWGTVIEHENLFRAEYQRILSVYVPGQCQTFGCMNPPEGLAYDTKHISAGIPYCAQCILDGEPEEEIGTDGTKIKIVNLANLSRMLGGIEVRFATPEIGW